MLRNFWNRPLGSKLILLLSVAMLVMFLAAPWQRTCNVTSASDAICGYRFAWQGHNAGKLIALFAILLIVWELLPVFLPKLSMRGWSTAIVTVLLAAGLVVTTFVKLIIDNEFQLVWAWVALGIAVTILVIAIARLRHRWGRKDEKPAQPPSPASAAGVDGT